MITILSFNCFLFQTEPYDCFAGDNIHIIRDSLSNGLCEDRQVIFLSHQMTPDLEHICILKFVLCRYNHPGCNFDFGDCCLKKPYSHYYCYKCECHDIMFSNTTMSGKRVTYPKEIQYRSDLKCGPEFLLEDGTEAECDPDFFCCCSD